MDKGEAKQREAAIEELHKSGTLVAEIVKVLTELAEAKEKRGEQAYAESSTMASTLRNVMIAVVFLGIVVGLSLGYFIARTIVSPLNKAVAVCQTVAHGDYSQRLDVRTRDEVGVMAQALNQSIDASVKMMDEIKEANERDQKKAEQLRHKVDDLLEVVGAAAEGDLTRTIKVEGNEAVDELAGGLRRRCSGIWRT